MAIPNSDLTSSLRQFLEDYTKLQPSQIDQSKTETSVPDINLLSNFFSSMTKSLETVRASAWNFDPWEVAGLGRDEVKNTSVLAWLLNPRGSHGMGSAVLRNLLFYINKQKNYFPVSAGSVCNVRTEICPNGDLSDRLDIEVDASNFYLIIEVKIDATEGNEQLSRYARQAQTQNGKRPWAIIYLTPAGKIAKTGGEYTEYIINISWTEIARIIAKSISTPPDYPSKSWYAANHAVTLFVKHIRNH